MPFTTKFSSPSLPQTGTFIIAQAGRSLSPRTKALNTKMAGGLQRAIKAKGFKGEKGQSLTLIAPQGVKLDQIILLGLGKANELNSSDFENLGGQAIQKMGTQNGKLSLLIEGINNRKIPASEQAARIGLGAKLGAYRFEQYKAKEKRAKLTNSITILCDDMAGARRAYADYNALANGICLARDLVNEPANILFPKEFAKRARALSKLGVKVEVLSEAQMKKLGMGALLGVGQGSDRDSQLVVMQWMGGKKSEKPLAFIGKGVCFDTGGISLKPAGGMEEMKGDMGGAAAVTGLMHSLAARKAKVNVVGVLGLVENMPSHTAQRPGDIVTSMSGQTIEVLNTDAEGRLVLADALWYTQKRFKPKFMIDLATLTGAIIIALGQDFAGMFTDDDKLAQQLSDIGEVEKEPVWRMPLCDSFEKMINTPNADMKNIGGGRNAGSATAAHFLRRFTNKLPWVHLDIAGTAMGSPKNNISRSWASGYGVKLLDRFVKKYYE